MTGAELLLKTAQSAGVNICFANPGTTEMDFVAALDRSEGIRSVLGLFEGVCTGMADGYHRMTGDPALVLLHLGVGLGNGIANLHNARRAGSGIVNIIGDHPADHLPYDAPLTSDIASMARGVSDYVTALHRENYAAQCAELFGHANEGTGRIVTATAPMDLMNDEVGTDLITAEKPHTYIDEASVEQMRTLLTNGKKVAVLLANEGLHEQGLRAAARVSQATGCTLLATAFPGRWDRGAGLPMVRRVPYFPEAVIELLEKFEVLILAGAKAPVAFFKYPNLPSSTVPDNCSVHTLCPEGQHPTASLEALADALEAPTDGYPVVELKLPDSPTGALNMQSVGAAIAATLPENAAVSDESATSGVPAFIQTGAAHRHSSMYLTGGGIGMGMPVATGAAIACPDRPVLSLQADGSGMYTLQALWTQARESLNVTTAIFSNRKYHILQVELARAGITDPGPAALGLTELTNPDLDWVSLAKGMGVPGTRPETAEELVQDLQNAYAEPGPHLIEVSI